MSLRVYQGPRSERRRGPGPVLIAIPWALALVTIVGQIAWVLVSDGARDAVTIATVVSFFLASVIHAAVTRGLAWAAGYLAISAGLGLAVEVVGTRTGWPFGPYSYGDQLGWQVLGVPIAVPLAWAMMAYPCLLAARSMSRSLVWVPLIAGWALAAWDIFLDPQMVGEGYWSWTGQGLEVPGIPGIPLQNFAGWLITAIVMMALLDRLPRRRGEDGVPTLLLAWTYAASVLSNALFFDRPGVAAWGAVLMGIVVIPWAWRLWVSRP